MPDARPTGDRRHLVLIPLAALVVVLPLIVRGCSCGHDFDFHLLSWFEAATQFAHGNLHPHWAFTPAYNAGEPRFVFYPPISWYLGAFLGLILTHLPGLSEARAWTATPVLYTWFAVSLSGLTMYRLAREFASANAALIAATLYLANPYMLFTAYERTAYAELLAAAWFPLLLRSILRKKVTIPGIALPLALLWLTNAPAAVMGSYALALLTLLRLASSAQEHNALSRKTSPLALASTTLAGTLLAFAAAAFYILPAAYERRYVQVAMATVGGMNIPANFLFHHTGTTFDEVLHDQVLHTVSVIAIILLISTALALAAAYLRRKHPSESHFPLVSLTLLAAVIAFLLTPLSLPIWNHAPQLTFLQFPWRLLAILAPILALAIARALSNSLDRFVASADQFGAMALIATALTVPSYRIFAQSCDPADTAPARLALFHSNIGTDPTDEYTPATADNEALSLPNPPDPDTPLPSNDPPYWLANSAEAAPPKTSIPGTSPTHLTIAADHPETLVLNLRDYPAWHITLNGTNASHSPRPDGLVAIPVPAGRSVIDIRYTRSPDQTLGDGISLAAIPVLLLVLRRRSAA
jgi:uncharacterized membrane protein